MDMGRARISKLGWWWLGGLFACTLFSWLLGWFDTSTELRPGHDNLMAFGFIAACIVTAVSIPLMFWQSSGPWFSRIMLCLLAAPLIALVGTFLLADEALALIASKVDFPPAQIQRFDGILVISRAYQTHGKGRSWNIQTMPIWANLDITEADYKFMRDHRSPADRNKDPDEIASDGYFCARVVLEQAGSALRIMHAGRYALPKGTVGTCADRLALNPALPVIGYHRDAVPRATASQEGIAR